MKRYKFKEIKKYKLKDFKRGQKVEINPIAEVSYTYKRGFVPSKILRSNIWYIDDIDYDEGIINVHALDAIKGEGEIGGVCSNVYWKDIIKIL